MAGRSAVSTRPAKPAGHVAMRGRQAEWQLVRELLRRAQRGLGGVLLVDGDPGMGKSLLLRESAREAAGQGFSLAAGRGDQLGRTCRSSPCSRRCTSRWAGGAGDRAGPPDLTAGRIGQLQAHLEQRAAAGPVLVSLDDLQWASPATLLALRVLPHELASSPVAWLLAGSKTRQDKGADLLFRVLEGDGASRITLTPLGDDAVLGVLTDAFGVPPDRSLLALATRAAGAPGTAQRAGPRPGRGERGPGDRRRGPAGLAPGCRSGSSSWPGSGWTTSVGQLSNCSRRRPCWAGRSCSKTRPRCWA